MECGVECRYMLQVVQGHFHDAARCCVVLRGAAWCCVVLRGVA